MAITIQAQLAKKRPIPGSQFSSQQASITIAAEVNDINQIVSEAARLYALAEQAVDAQLAGNPPTVTAPGLAARDFIAPAAIPEAATRSLSPLSHWWPAPQCDHSSAIAVSSDADHGYQYVAAGNLGTSRDWQS